MKPRNIITTFLGLAVAASLLAACTSRATPTPPGMTVNFTDKGCTYQGPTSIPFGNVAVKWIVNDTKHTSIVLVTIALAPGKTVDDLKALQAAGTQPNQTPSWVNVLWIDQEDASGAALERTRTYTHEHDLTSQVNYNGEPIYMACGNEKGIIDVVGPITVTK